MSATGHEIRRVAERALLVRFHDADLARAVARAHALAARLRREQKDPPSGSEAGESGNAEGRSGRLSVNGEWILGAGNLLIRCDDSCAASDLEAMADRLDEVVRVLPFDESFSVGRVHTLEVDFGREHGLDLEDVARETGLGADEVVARFCAATYTVAFVGFSPGYPYLVGLPSELEVPRLAAPRTRVPAGSVAIAGPFAGVYPSATPGGWRLLGHTEAHLFDPASDPPARCAAGDRVRFTSR